MLPGTAARSGRAEEHPAYQRQVRVPTISPRCSERQNVTSGALA